MLLLYKVKSWVAAYAGHAADMKVASWAALCLPLISSQIWSMLTSIKPSGLVLHCLMWLASALLIGLDQVGD
jgi:hypothetical protein